MVRFEGGAMMTLETSFAAHIERDQWNVQVMAEKGGANFETGQIFADHGGYLYDSDYYGDDLPFWMPVEKSDGSTLQRLIVPYTLDTNDMRFSSPQGFNTGDHFVAYLKDAFDVLYAEGDEAPKMLSIGMHCRLLGRPARFRALQRFLDHVQAHDRVWITRRIDIARHWMQVHPAAPAALA